jgi:hypothetical protein
MNDMASIRKMQPLSVATGRGLDLDLGSDALPAGKAADFFREGKKLV